MLISLTMEIAVTFLSLLAVTLSLNPLFWQWRGHVPDTSCEFCHWTDRLAAQKNRNTLKKSYFPHSLIPHPSVRVFVLLSRGFFYCLFVLVSLLLLKISCSVKPEKTDSVCHVSHRFFWHVSHMLNRRRADLVNNVLEPVLDINSMCKFHNTHIVLYVYRALTPSLF